MNESEDARRQPPVPPPPDLPDVRSAPTEELLDGLPSRDDVADGARPAAEIVGEQPSVDDILRTDRQ